ncbi:MAG: ATP-grasp domain-containing protein [Candidatus Endonucleobacter bathymodioli]|uniref:ATP-grasp domain-containing protein n=1 Tax=Candidatus Endonucleibacter bathymodioli TaxID=539814 RepID=A0AA90P105_9GAMM|nr:ATP-grasp domain-containing protein [Candidatus Endonucleobacter bathymodioli]
MTKRVLLVGSSFSAVPIFFKLKERGFHVSVCGNVSGDPCHKYADESFFFDYSQREKLLELVESQTFDYLVPSCNDYSYMSCAWVASHFDFPGYDSYKTALILHNKSDFREFTSEYNLPAPRALKTSDIDNLSVGGFEFPLLVKPVDSFSGRGVIKVDSAEGLATACDVSVGSSRAKSLVIEEFVSGGLHSHSAFIKDGKIVVEFFVDEFCTVYPYQVNCSNHPSKLSDGVQRNISAAMSRLVGLLQLSDGLLHTQLIVEEDKFWIVECMRRCPGDLYGYLVDMSAGIQYTDLLVRSYIAEDLPGRVPLGVYKNCVRHTVSSAEPINFFSYSHAIPGEDVWVVPLKNSGEELGVAPYDKLAIIFSEVGSYEAMLELSPVLDSLISIKPVEG